jgi:RNA polymerase sigma-70 factor (ECF subfamily)
VDAADLARRRVVVDAFLTASRNGDFAELLRVLDPDVVLHADEAAIAAAVANRAAGAPNLAAELQGAELVAAAFSGRARAGRPALIDGAPGAAWVEDGRPRALFVLTIVDGRIVAIDLLSDADAVRARDVVLL